MPWFWESILLIGENIIMFSDERSRWFGVITVGFECVFGANSSWEIGVWEYPEMNLYGGTVVCDGIKQEQKLMESFLIHLVHCLELDEHLNRLNSNKDRHLRNIMPLLSMFLE